MGTILVTIIYINTFDSRINLGLISRPLSRHDSYR